MYEKLKAFLSNVFLNRTTSNDDAFSQEDLAPFEERVNKEEDSFVEEAPLTETELKKSDSSNSLKSEKQVFLKKAEELTENTLSNLQSFQDVLNNNEDSLGNIDDDNLEEPYKESLQKETNEGQTSQNNDISNTNENISQNNLIKGTPGDDTIKAGKGDDTIYAGDGDDTIRAGKGDDTIYAGDGDDTIRAGKGDDIIYAGDGSDTIFGGGR